MTISLSREQLRATVKGRSGRRQMPQLLGPMLHGLAFLILAIAFMAALVIIAEVFR